MYKRLLVLTGLIALGLAACAPQVNDGAGKYRTSEYDRSWGLEAINAAAAYQYLDELGINKRGDAVVIAVSDGGIDAQHIDLDDNLSTLSADQFEFDKGNAYDSSHGSHVAGIAAGEKNDRGIHGVAYKANIASVVDEPYAVAYAAAEGADVINMSWGIGGSNDEHPLDQDVLSEDLSFFADAAQSGAILVTTLANLGEDRHGYPVGFVDEGVINDQMIIVGAIDESRNIASFGCGESPEAELEHCLVAPGAQIVSVASKRVAEDEEEDPKVTIDGAEYFRWDGSSMAAPFVAGSAALLKSLNPALSAKEIVRILLDTATPMHAAGEDPSQLSPTFGHGLLNLEAAVKAVASP